MQEPFTPPAQPPGAPPEPAPSARLLKGVVGSVLIFAAILACIVGAQWYALRRVNLGTLVDTAVVLDETTHVVQAAFAPDGKSLVAVMSDGTMMRYALPGLDRPSPIDLGTSRRVKRVRFLAGGRVFVPEWELTPVERLRREKPGAPPLTWLERLMTRGADDPSIPILYDSLSGKRLGVLEDGEGVDRLVASPDGIYLAALQSGKGGGGHGGGGGAQEVLVWDQKGRLKHRFHPEQPVVAFAFHPIEEKIAFQQARKEGTTVTFHDLGTGEATGSLTTGGRGPLIVFTPDGRELAVGSKTMQLWEWKMERKVASFVWQPQLEDLVFSADGQRMLLVSSARPGTHLFRVQDRGQQRPSKAFVGDWISPDWKTVGSLEKGVVTIRDPRTGEVRGTLTPHRQHAVLGFSEKGGRFATAEDPGVIHMWDLETHKIMQTARGPAGRVLALSRDWTVAVTKTSRGYTVWSYPDGAEMRTFVPDKRYWWTFVQLTPDQRQLLFARRSEDGSSTAITWDPEDGSTLQVLAPWTVSAYANVVGMAPGRRVAGSTTEQWQAYSDDERAELWQSEAPEGAIRILADDKGETFYFVGRRRVYRVKAHGGEIESSFAHDGVLAPPNSHVAAITPEGNLMATAESEESSEIVVWETSSGKRVATLRGHTMPAVDVMFSADGRNLLSIGSDGKLLLWRLPTPGKGGGGH